MSVFLPESRAQPGIEIKEGPDSGSVLKHPGMAQLYGGLLTGTPAVTGHASLGEHTD